jgi:tRNA modification GTPase
MSGVVHDTICAIATPVGEGGIGIVRLSGAKAIDAAAAIVRPRSGQALRTLPSHTLHLADLLDQPPRLSSRNDAPGRGRALDEALVVVMRAPRSYTGEDLVELHCHGGPLILQQVCEALVRHGARVAEPGEFTKRAFLNGRLDLSQAEAVLDTIQAKTAGSLRIAQEQLRGALSRRIGRIRDPLIGLLAQVEAGIDFTEEDIAFVEAATLLTGLRQAATDTARLTESYEEGRLLREGVTAVIVGRPNVGKSSLLNALLQTDRAIVTPVPGTTRDVLEEFVNIRGLPVRLLDTAGVHETADAVEQEGVRRSRDAMERADLLLFVIDGSVPLTGEDRALGSQLHGYENKKRLLVVNKADLPSKLELGELASLLDPQTQDTDQIHPFEAPVLVSALTGSGLEELRDRIRSLCLQSDPEPDEAVLVTRIRHRDALLRATEALHAAAATVEAGLAGEFVAVDLRGAINALGEITGEVTTDDILDRIFRDFCIGK